MAFDAAPWLGPLGPMDGRLVKESRELAARSPQVFVKAAVLWALLSACIAVVQGRVQPMVYGRENMGGSLVAEMLMFFLGLVLALLVDGWLSRWALYRISRRQPLSVSEAPLYTLQPGIWAGLASVNFLAAAARLVTLILSLAGLAPTTVGAVATALGLSATFLGLRAMGIFYRLRQPGLFVWSVLWPPLALAAIMMAVAIVSGQIPKFHAM